MRIPRIFCDQPLTTGDVVTLDEAASRHLIKVLRMEAGRPLILFNGHGGEYQATLHSLGKKQATVMLERHLEIERSSPLSIHLGIGLSKGDRLEWVLQKATELGVRRITPLFTARSEVKLSGERLDKKCEHWRQIVIAACEQCQLNRVPEISPPQRLDQWLPSLTEECKLVLHHRSEAGLGTRPAPARVALVIGPEGGLSDTEINQTLQQGFEPLTLGPRVLRTETAPLTAISVLQYLWGDLGSP